MTLLPDTHRHLLAHHRDFEAFAEAIAQSHAGRFDDVFWAVLTKYGPSAPLRVVDLGTGPGLLLPELAARYPGAEIVGVDGQPAMVERAQRACAHEERIRVVDHDLAAGSITALEAASTDLVIASMLLHEMQVPTKLLDEIARLLRPGGVLVLSDWIRFSLASYSQGKRPDSLDEYIHFSEHCRYTADDLVWLAEKSGFTLRECLTRRSGAHVLLALERSPAAAAASSSTRA